MLALSVHPETRCFNLGDNDDTGNDYLGYYSGENGTAAHRPQLVVTYQ